MFTAQNQDFACYCLCAVVCGSVKLINAFTPRNTSNNMQDLDTAESTSSQNLPKIVMNDSNEFITVSPLKSGSTLPISAKYGSTLKKIH